MRRSVAVAALLVLTPVAARALTPEDVTRGIGAFAPAKAKSLVDALCDPELKGRVSGSDGCLAAATKIRDALREAGVKAEVETAGGFPHAIATIEGSDKAGEAILVSAHFDGPGEVSGKLVPGADECGSGTAALVEIARGLAQAKPRRTIFLGAFSGYWNEEDEKRFRAAKAWAEASKKKIGYHVDVAMVGVGLFPKEPERVFAVGAESAEGGHQLVAAAALAEKETLKVTRTSMYLVEGRGPRDNYSSLRELGIPFVYITTGVSKFYHKAEDAPGTIDPARIVNAARFALRIVGEVDALDALPAFKKEPQTDDMSDAKEVLALVELALAPSSALEMTKTSREALSWKIPKIKEMIERGSLTAKDKATLQRTLESLLYVLMQ